MARLLIQLDQTTGGPLPAGALTALTAAGVNDVRPSHAELPGLYIAIVPDTVDVDGLASQLKSVPGIRHAEVERFRSAF